MVDASIAQPISPRLEEEVARLLGAGKLEGEGIPLSDLCASAASELGAYGRDLAGVFVAARIRIPPAIHLQVAEQGHVLALGNHPQRSRVAELINLDDSLLLRFREIELLHILIRRTELARNGQSMSCQHFNIGLTSLGCIAFFTEC